MSHEESDLKAVDHTATILTIDDEASIRQSFSAYLEDHDYLTLAAGNGREGLQVFRQKRADLVLVDLRMPEVDGLEVLAALTEEAPQTPVIVVSATGILSDVVEALRLGAWDYLIKPIEDMHMLLLAVQKALERSRLLRENQQYHAHLEAEVQRRTAELERTNATLLNEITVRIGAEQELATHRDQLEDLVAQRTEALQRSNMELEQAIEHAQKMAQKADEAAQTKGEFLANVSHEIRTPMSGVLGMTDVLLGTEMTQQQRHYVDMIQKNGHSLMQVINDVLDFSKIEAGKLKFDVLDFSLWTTIEDINDTLAVKAHQKSLEYLCAIDSDAPVLLRGDPMRLRQIITNLVGNAIKFTHEGEIMLRVSLEHDNSSRAVLRFTVTDTGIGISASQAQKLFEPFTQAESSTSRKYGGTGLGLSISRQLCKMMGGEIGIKSTEGEGTACWFTASFEKPDIGRRKEVGSAVGFRGKRVLIVDNNDNSRAILGGHVASRGCRQDAVAMEAALALLQQATLANDPYHIVLLDVYLHEAQARKLMADILKIPSLSKTPVIALVPFGKRNETSVFEREGFSGVLTKPVRQAFLSNCLLENLGLIEK